MSDLPASNTGGAQDISLDDKSGLAKTTPPSASVKTAPTPPELEAEPAVAPTVASIANDAAISSDGDDKTIKAAVIETSNTMKSLTNTSSMVEKAESQSTDMQTGAQVAHDNAVQSFVKKFKALVEIVGEDVAKEVKEGLAKLHDAEEIVENVLKTAGLIAR